MPSDRELWELHQQGKSYRELADTFTVTTHRVRGGISRYNSRMIASIANASTAKPQAGTARYEGDVFVPADDYKTLQAHIAAWRKTHKYIKVMHVADLHIDDHNPQAVELHFQIAARYKPDLILYTGDTHDFSEISRFAQSWRGSKRQDLFKRYRPYWQWVVEGLHNAAPNAVQVAFNGNHNERLEPILNDFWQFAETIIDAYAAMMRAGGRVLWIDSIQELNIGSYFVQHGTRHGENAAKNALKDLGWGQSAAQGHTHQPAQFIHTVKLPYEDTRRIVTYTVAPCSCNIPPAYAKRTTKQSRWINGTLLSTVNLRGFDVHEQLVLYHPTRNGLTAAFGGDVLRVNKQAKAN